MIRNLKVLGLALVAMLTMGVVVASSASAQTLTTGLTPNTHTEVTLKGEIYEKSGSQVGLLTENDFNAFGTNISCTTVTYEGTASGTDHEIRLAPTYDHCGVVQGTAPNDTLGMPATVTMNGCEYKIKTPTQIGANEFTSKVDLVCTGAGPVIHVYGGGTYTSHSTNLCTVEITANQELGHVIMHNNDSGAKDDVTATVNVSNIHAVRSGLCLLDGKGSTTSEAKFTSNITLTDKAGKDDVWISTEE